MAVNALLAAPWPVPAAASNILIVRERGGCAFAGPKDDGFGDLLFGHAFAAGFAFLADPLTGHAHREHR